MLPVDANASWARPGPRLVDGIEQLAARLRQLGGVDRRQIDPVIVST